MKRVGKKPGPKPHYRRKKVGETILGDPIYRRVKVTAKKKVSKKRVKKRKKNDTWGWF